MITLVLASVLTLTNGFGRVTVDTLGARVTSYVPSGGSEILVMLESGTGGIPVCWPWFCFNGPAGEKSAKHGIARYREFEVVAVSNRASASEATLRLVSDAATRLQFPHDFVLTMRIRLDAMLHLELTAENTGSEAFAVTEAFHPYLDRSAVPRLLDRGNGKYRIWNPDASSCFKTSGLGRDDFRKFVCVENGTFDPKHAYRLEPGKRRQLKRAIGPRPAAETFVVRPTFVSCGIEFLTRPDASVIAEWRKSGTSGPWTRLEDFVPFETSQSWRGSILGLAEDTAYDLRVRVGENPPETRVFRTWASEVPVARTVVIDPKTAVFPVVVDAKGSAEGWVRYALPPGSKLVNATTNDTLVVAGAAYVLLDDMILEGGGRTAVSVTKSQHVRIRNCDISGWGRTGPVAFDRKARRIDANGGEINFDGAISIGKGAAGTVVERCYVHDPRGRANSWYYSHPTGPEAVMLRRPDHSTVIRYCDFVGSDLHRFNDAVEGEANFSANGGFNRDADIYGNFMIYCNDDCIELDGGQRNVRCFGNRFESALCGVSVQGCMVSPSYVVDNLFSGMCDEFGFAGQTIKTGGGKHGPDATSFVRNNVLAGSGWGISMRPDLGCRLTGNAFAGRQTLKNLKGSPRSISVGNVFGADIDLSGPLEHPRRPAPFVLSRGKFADVTGDFALTATATGKTPVAFTVRQPTAMDWFSVEPTQGRLEPGHHQTLTVHLDRTRMKDRRHYRGAFLVRTPDGLSRPVSFACETGYVTPVRVDSPGETAVYVECPKTPLGEARTFTFSVPKTGRYYFLIHAASETRKPSVLAGVDGEDPLEFEHTYTPYPQWVMLSPGGRFGNTIRHYDLGPGEHTLTVAGPSTVTYDAVVLTDSPGSFEPR